MRSGTVARVKTKPPKRMYSASQPSTPWKRGMSGGIGAITTECVAVLPSRKMVKTVLAPFGFCVTSASAGI